MKDLSVASFLQVPDPATHAWMPSHRSGSPATYLRSHGEYPSSDGAYMGDCSRLQQLPRRADGVIGKLGGLVLFTTVLGQSVSQSVQVGESLRQQAPSVRWSGGAERHGGARATATWSRRPTSRRQRRAPWAVFG